MQHRLAVTHDNRAACHAIQHRLECDLRHVRRQLAVAIRGESRAGHAPSRTSRTRICVHCGMSSANVRAAATFGQDQQRVPVLLHRVDQALAEPFVIVRVLRDQHRMGATNLRHSAPACRCSRRRLDHEDARAARARRTGAVHRLTRNCTRSRTPACARSRPGRCQWSSAEPMPSTAARNDRRQVAQRAIAAEQQHVINLMLLQDARHLLLIRMVLQHRHAAGRQVRPGGGGPRQNVRGEMGSGHLQQAFKPRRAESRVLCRAARLTKCAMAVLIPGASPLTITSVFK